MPPFVANLPKPRSLGGRILEVVAAMVFVSAFMAMVLGIGLLVLTGNHPGGRDFVSFWAAARQVLHHANPYDSATILEIEKSVGFPPDTQSLIMRNAPWSLSLVMPLGLFGLRSAALLWSVMLTACLLLSVHILWLAYGRPGNRLHLLGCTFGPALACILGGQTGLFPLLGLVLFLRFHRQRPLLAGMSLWLCILKPHLFLPFGVVLLVWIVRRRSYRILWGLGLTLLVSSLIASALDPGVWTQYRQMMLTAGIEREFIPCLAVALRFAIHQQAMWLEYLPAAAGCIWALRYYRRHRSHWDWLEHGALLMLVSVVVAPYMWCTDQAVLIPALLYGVYHATSRTQLGLLALASSAIECELVLNVSMHSALLLWTAPFWLLWYLLVTLGARTAESPNLISQSNAA